MSFTQSILTQQAPVNVSMPASEIFVIAT